MIALLALLLLQDPADAKPQAPAADVTCVDIVTFEIQNSDTQRSIIADDHKGYRWVPASELASLKFPEANLPLIEVLAKPAK